MSTPASALLPTPVLARPQRLLLTVALAATVVAGVAEVLAVAALGRLVPHLTGRSDPTAPWLVLGAAATWAAGTAVAAVAGRRCGYGMASCLHDAIATHLLRLPLAWFGGRRAGEVSFLLGPQTMQVMTIPAHLLVPAARAVVVPLGLVVVIAAYDLVTGLVTLAWLPVLGLTQWGSTRRAAAGDAALAQARTEASARVIEYVEGQRTLRLLPDADHATRLVKRAIGEVAQRMEEQVEPVVRVLGLFGLATQLMLVSVAATGLLRPESPTAGEATMLLVALVTLGATVQAAAGLSAQLRAAYGALQSVRAFLEEPALPEPERPVTPAPARPATLAVEDLHVGPDADAPILRGIDVALPTGGVTAIVGASGAGKTTLLRVLARFCDPVRGRVLLDGVDCRDLGSAAVHERVAMVFQDVELFTGTVLDNIRIGRPDASDADVGSAARRAGLTEMLHRLPDGLDTVVGEHGVGLSGGERQRVSIARALLKDAPLLLLDEPAAGLDATHHALVDDTVAQLRGATTVVVVTHRLVSARRADLVLVLDGGRLVEHGTHDALLARAGAYASLWQADQTTHPDAATANVPPTVSPIIQETQP